MLPVAVDRSFSDDTAIRYVLPVLWMTSCFHIVEPVGQIQRVPPGCVVGGELVIYEWRLVVTRKYVCA